jgi:hypothetical protein
VVTSTAHIARRTTPSRHAKVEARPWLKPVARVGLLARAVVYTLLAVLAALIAVRGSSPSPTSGQGALAEIVRQPAGPFLLGLLSAGLLAYGAWRLVQAVTGLDPGSRDLPSIWQRIGWLFIAGVYLMLFAHAIGLIAGTNGGSNGPSNHPNPYAATVLRWPGGVGLLGLAGAGIVIGGVALAVWAVVHDYERTFLRSRMEGWEWAAVRVLGIAGNVVRAALLVLIGIYLLMGAVQGSPSKVKSLDQVLETGVHQSLGPLWVSLGAAGLAAFALYSVAEAAYRRV